ncbi:hypothetical protein [Ascidiimonas aurantiaca]|uniref:GntT/GntP/DsdX family permease n=1 Tax=Ascidiimonas aurantiaca TaxID=1685432 RepID=UPI0030EF0BB5
MLTGFPLLLCILASILLIVVLTSRYKFHPFLALVIACFFLGICSGMSFPVLLRSMQEGFGGLMASIGLIVIFGSVIGVFLEKSGGALQIARYIIQLSGKKKNPLCHFRYWSSSECTRILRQWFHLIIRPSQSQP